MTIAQLLRSVREPLVFCLLLAPLGCVDSVPESLRAVPAETFPSCNVPSTTVIHSYFGPQAPQLRVIGDRAEWCALWDQLTTDSGPKECDESLIDFDREVAIVAALGPRNTTGYDVGITCVHRANASADLQVFVTESAPGESCVTGQAFTSPVQVVKAARPAESATFEKQIEVYECH